MKKVGFIIVTYKPTAHRLEKLEKNLKDKFVIVVDNTVNNRGFGGGANAGMRQAIKTGAEWVVVLNQDIGMTREAVNALCGQLETLPRGIAGPFAGSLDPKRWTTILGNGIEYISGACMAIHKDVIEKVGYFYEPYFMYYEDVDFSVRAVQRGFPLTHLPIKGIGHKEHSNKYFLARNHLLFVLRLAPLNVKLRELIRLPKTIAEYFQKL